MVSVSLAANSLIYATIRTNANKATFSNQLISVILFVPAWPVGRLLSVQSNLLIILKASTCNKIKKTTPPGWSLHFRLWLPVIR